MKVNGYFNSGPNKLYYIAHLPSELNGRRTGLIYIHADGGNRYGPHRMFVEHSNKFSEKYYCIRIDLSGCGDSSGDSQDNLELHKDDIISAINHFNKLYCLEQIFLFGISRGAYLINRILLENRLPVSGSILLSCPVANQQAAIDTLFKRIKEYSLKLFDAHSFKKLITGRANVKYIYKSLMSALSLRKRYAALPVSNNRFRTNCPLFFIYGQNDPICTSSEEFYRQQCQKYNVPWHSHTVACANHSFFHYMWKDEIYNVVQRWLDSQNTRPFGDITKDA